MNSNNLIFVDAVTPAGTQNGVNAVFTLPSTPNPPMSLVLTLNGVVQDQGSDYTLLGATVTYTGTGLIPQAGNTQLAWYRYTTTSPSSGSTTTPSGTGSSKFIDYCSELVGTIPRLPFPLAQKLVNRAWLDIRQLRLWSFLVSSADNLSALNVSTGTVTVVQGVNQVTLDATAAAALSPLVFANPPLAAPTVGIGRQIRIGSIPGSAGPLYSILAYDGAFTLTLDRNYAETSGAGLNYMCYKAYFSPPVSDFVRYFTVTNVSAGYTVKGKKLYYTQRQLNSIDPQRGGTGDAYIISAYEPDANGNPVHEWYPHPVNQHTYNCLFQRRGTDLSSTVDLPPTFPSDVLIAKAFTHAAAWAQANLAQYPELQMTNWVMFSQDRKQEFKDALIQAIKQDDEISPLIPFQQGSSFDFPLGGQFLQGHDVSSLIGEY